MMSTENQSGGINSASEENVVRQLGPELESGLETPKERLLKQRLFSESASDLKSEMEGLGMPIKYLKGSDSSNLMLPDGHNNMGEFNFRGHRRIAPSIDKENRNPGFLGNVNLQDRPKNKRKKRKIKIGELTPEEGSKLLEVWEKNHFIDFNTWLQCAKAKITTDIVEKEHIVAVNPERTFKTKSYQCHLKLFFSDLEYDSIFANGVGKSKKQARKMAIKQIVTLLIQRKMIKMGLKDKSFMCKDDIRKDSTKLLFRYGYGSLPKVDNSSVERERRLKKEIKRLNKRLHLSLKNDNFVEACQYFCQIISNKAPEWNEVCQIWSFAVLKRDPKLTKVILDLLQYKRVKHNLSEELKDKEQEEDTIKVPPNQENEDTIEVPKPINIRSQNQRYLKYIYGFQRIQNDNPYDLVDFENFKYSEPEGVLNPEGIKSLGLTDPEGFNINLDEFNQRTEKVDTDKLVDLLGFEDDNIESGEDGAKGLPQSEEERKGLTEYMPRPCKIKINRTTNKEFKDPNINYLNPKLLNQMYDMLMYSGDAKFSVQTAEMLFTNTRLSDQSFITPYACHYYAHRKNMMQIEFLESVYKAYFNPEHKRFGFVRLEGKLQKIGYKFKQQVLTFQPEENDSVNLDRKIVRRGFSVLKDITDIRANVRVNEKEYVMLIALEKETEIKGDPEFNDLLNEEGGPSRGYHSESEKNLSMEKIKDTFFFQQNVSKGRKVRHMMFGFVTDISRDFLIKLYSLPTENQALQLKSDDSNLEWVLYRMPVPGFHVSACESLYDFTTRENINSSIAHIIFSPPLTAQIYLKEIQDTRADLQIHQSHKTKNQINSILKDLSERLDQSQLQAVTNALCKSFSLVHAASCTGKMAAIVEIVTAWLSLSSASILVCAESNMKADMLHMALSKGGIYSVRLFNSPDNYENEAITGDFEDTVEHLKENQTYFNAYYIRYPIIKKIISKASVVCTTLEAMSGEYLNGNFFPRAIIDDTSSCFEPLVLGPLTKNCQHVVLFGDHKLSPPKANSEFSISKGIQISLFERLVKQGYPCTFLDYQYLINPTISFFPSLYFYSEFLKSGVDQSQLPTIQGFNWPNPPIGMALINVPGCEEHATGTIQNSMEAELVAKILVKFLSQGEIDISEIGILTTYYGQKRLLKKVIELAKLKYPSIFTGRNGLESQSRSRVMVDLVGKEKTIDKELIIISTVRSNKEKNIGILRDSRILNSMITKGRRGVVILGNLKTLSGSPCWREFIYWAQSNSIILNYN